MNEGSHVHVIFEWPGLKFPCSQDDLLVELEQFVLGCCLLDRCDGGTLRLSAQVGGLLLLPYLCRNGRLRLLGGIHID